MSTNVSNNSSNPTSKETTSRYKKLSLLFHPDKFSEKLHTGVATFFSLLTKFHKQNNLHMLEVIDSISHLILELPSLEILRPTGISNRHFVQKIEVSRLRSTIHNDARLSIQYAEPFPSLHW